MAEKYGKQYDGSLLMCGVLGGAEAHFNWLASVRILFDYYYPGVLPGDVTAVPPGTDLANDIQIPAFLAISANPLPVLLIAAIDQSPLAGFAPGDLGTSLITALSWHARGINDVISRSHGHLPFSNLSDYTDNVALFGVPADSLTSLNNNVPRYDSPPSAQAWVDHNFQPSGKVQFPILTLHTTQDPSVPFFHETLFGQIVASAGTGNLVVQRPINRFGHCTFTVNEMLTAFGDLVNWVENDIKPTP
jgi:hypothetical protein